MNTTEQFTVYATSRRDAIEIAKAVMNFKGAQIDVERIAPGQWLASIYSRTEWAI
jgi:hypothetical protein